MVSLVRLFRRETLSTDFIPVIDGLRFLAISMVVLYHVDVYILVEAAKFQFAPAVYYPWANILSVGHQGVQLFFVISGFVLALPFMRERFGLTEKRVSLGGFFLRRLTRLEPPYVLCIIGLFFVRAFVISDRYSFGDLVLSMFSSLFYSSNFVFPGELPHINGITWSLEVEVQFYILAPFLTGAVCMIKNKLRRRLATLALILATAAFSWYMRSILQIHVESLASYLQYFLSGILLCDIFLLDSDWIGGLSSIFGFLAGLALLVLVISFDHSGSPNILIKMISPLMILGFYLTVFGNSWWRKIFSLGLLTSIGGMCYSIYLLHWMLISLAGRFAYSRLWVSNYYAFFLIQSIVYLIPIAIISAAYFLLIEKPCMKRDWYIRLYRRLGNLTQPAKTER